MLQVTVETAELGRSATTKRVAKTGNNAPDHNVASGCIVAARQIGTWHTNVHSAERIREHSQKTCLVLKIVKYSPPLSSEILDTPHSRHSARFHSDDNGLTGLHYPHPL